MNEYAQGMICGSVITGVLTIVLNFIVGRIK